MCRVFNVCLFVDSVKTQSKPDIQTLTDIISMTDNITLNPFKLSNRVKQHHGHSCCSQIMVIIIYETDA